MKNFVCLFLVISLVLACSGSAFAAPELATGSAFGVDERLLAVSRLAASANPVGSSTDPFYVRPFTNGSATVYRYTWSTSNPYGSAPGTNQTFTNFADIVTHITSSIAQSFLALGQRLHYDNDAIYGRLYDILTAIGNSVSPEFWVSSSNDHTGIFPSSSSSYWSNISSRGLKRVSSWYLLSASGDEYLESVDDLPLFQQLKYILITTNTSLVRGLNRLTFHNSGDYSLYSMHDMTSIDIPDSYSTGSLWDTTIRGFSNLSYGLSRLVYVLANDEDIEARDASASVRQAYTNDFLKPSGSASASASDFGTLASGSSSVSDSFHSSYGASDALGALSDQSDGRWDWFSQSTMDNLNSSGNRSSSMLKSNRGYTNFYEDRYRAIKHD